jgi:hypothetical protein
VSTALDALVAVETPLAAYDCVIRDMNQFGARIEVGRKAVPDEFYLIDVLSALAYRGRTVWRQQGQAGVKFLETHRLYAPSAPAWLVQLQRARLRADAVERTDALTSDIPG